MPNVVGHADHRHQLEADAGIHHELHAAKRRREHLRMHERRRDAPALHHAEDDREVARDLRELLAAALPFLLELLKGGNHGRKELNHDLRGDVRPDGEEADGALSERAAGEHLEPVEETAAARGGADILDRTLKRLPVHARGRNLRNEAANRHQTQGDQDFLAQFRNLERVPKSFPHRHFLSAPFSF